MATDPAAAWLAAPAVETDGSVPLEDIEDEAALATAITAREETMNEVCIL